MQRCTIGLLGSLAAIALSSCAGSSHERKTLASSAGELRYPPAHRSEHTDVYHGVEVRDPFRWLEDGSSADTEQWIAGQERLFETYVSAVPNLEEMERRLARIGQREAYGTPVRRGRRFFFTRNLPGATHGAIYVQDGLDGEPRMVIDFAEVIDEPSHRAAGFSVSPDGRHVVWASTDPSRWGWLDVGRVADGQRLEERLEGIAGSSAIWTHDNRGFFYVRYGTYEALMAGAEPIPQLLYHLLGTDPSDDVLVFERQDDRSVLFGPKLSDDGRYLVLSLNAGTASQNRVIYKDLTQQGGTWLPLIDEADASYGFEGNVRERFFFTTTLEAPRGRVIAIDLGRPQRVEWIEVIPQRAATLNAVSHIGGRLVVRSSQHARPIVEVWSYEGRLESTLQLPDIGLLSGFGDDPESPIAFYRLNNLYDPGTIYRVDLRDGRSEPYQTAGLSYDPARYEIRQVFYESGDGARIPMFLAHRKDVPLKSDRPLYMYGYGHGGWVAFPWFQPMLVEWLDRGGIYALPGLRGGGEYGREWQEAGTRLNKPNTIDDFIAAAEWLVDQGYTSPGQLVANGGSASGVVPAAAAVRRPDLFAVAVIEFPFLDMLRYHEFTTVKGWTQGYGSAERAEEFQVLQSYSPLHTLEAGRCYPAMLTLVGEKDTVTVPMHGYKFTAALQTAQGCDRPGLLKLIRSAGHYSYGTSPEETARTQAETLAFLIRALDLAA